MTVSRSLVACIGLTLQALTPTSEAERPNLEGVWTGGTLTPLERPAHLADKPYLSPEEMSAQQRAAAERFWAAGHKPGEVGRDNDAFIEPNLEILPNGQTSLVVEPPHGTIPLRPEVEAVRDRNLHTFDSYETMSQWDRCITRQPGALLPVIYNNAYQIVQTPTHVVITAEMIHDARIVPLDGRPHIDARIRSWEGDSRGRWEGDALVIETTNFHDRGWLLTSQGVGRMRGVPFSEQMRTVERLQLVDAHTLLYELTIEDPKIYTAPWTIRFPLKRDDSYQILEYACHEGNSAVEMMLRGARVQEAAASERAAPPPTSQ